MRSKKIVSILLAFFMVLTLIPMTVFAEETDQGSEVPHEHSYTAEETVEPTCTEGGYTVYTCACGDSYTEYTDPSGHSWDEGVVTLEPTAEADGEITYTCSACGETYTETVEKLTDGSDEENPEEEQPEGEESEEPKRGESTKAAEGENYWTWLQEQIDSAGSDPSDPTLIELPDDVINTENKTRIIVGEKASKNITIDLKGHTINRCRESSDTNGHVIEVMNGSTLTIKDSSDEKTGTITGGWATNGGGINIHADSKVIIQGGTISGNKASNGGAFLQGAHWR